MATARTPARGSSLLRVVAWAAIAILTVYLVFIGGGFAGIYLVQLRILSLALVAAVLGIWLGWSWRHSAWRPRTVLWSGFAAALLIFAVCTALSPTPRLGMDYLAYAVLLTGLYLLLVRLWANPFFRSRLGVLSVALSLALCVAYIVAVGAHWVAWWSLVGAIRTPPLRPWFESLTFGNPSEVMTMALLLAAPAIAHLGLGTRGSRAMVALLAVLALAVTLLSGSRSGWLALPIGVALTGLAWLLVEDHRSTVARMTTGRLVRPAILAVVVATGAAGVLVGPGVLNRVGAGGEALRATFWAAALRMFQASPLHGVGPGAWVADRIAYTPSTETDYYIPHAHDLYLQTLAEFGILGVVAGVIAIGSLAWLIRAAVRDADPIRRRFGWAALFATAYFGAHQLLDFYANMPTVLFAFALPVAFLDATQARPMQIRGTSLPGRLPGRLTGLPGRLPGRLTGLPGRLPGRLTGLTGLARLAPVALAVLAAASVGFLAWSESAANAEAAAVAALGRGDWPTALASARDAASADPDMTPYQLTLGLAAARSGQPQLARVALERAASTGELPQAWLDLADVRLNLGDAAGARDALSKALRLGTQQPAVDLGAASLYLRLGDGQAAEDALVAAIVITPSLAGDPAWVSDRAFGPTWPALLQRAIATAEPTAAWEIALVGGDTASAERIANTLAADDRDLALLVIPAWAGDATATHGLQARALAQPLDVAIVSWCARIASRQGDEATSSRYREWASTLDGVSGPLAAEMRIVPAFGPGDVVAGVSSGFYGQYTYRRPTPVDLLVPDLPRLTYR